MTPLIIAAVFFLASFVQSVSGFGFGLVSIGLLAGLIGVPVAAPIVALLSMIVQIAILAHYHESFDLRSVIHLSIGSLLGVPVGVWLLDRVDQTLILHLLGLILLGYSAYALLNLRLPRIERPVLAYPFGIVSGILGGLYNVGGPPVIIYATCCAWPPDRFRSNLQGFFMVSGTVVLAAHLIGGHFTGEVITDSAIAVVPVLAGIGAGVLFNRHLLKPLMFRKVVFVALALIGLRLLL